MRAVVTGMIGTFPVGGVAWDYGQYALGLERLGFETYYLEDTGIPVYRLNRETGEWEEDCSYGVRFLEESLALLSPTLARRWHFRERHGRSFGIPARDMALVVADADVLINISAGTVLHDAYRRCRRTIVIDTDPGWNQFVVFPEWARRWPRLRGRSYAGHDLHFTYAERIGHPDCPIPALGFVWHPTRPPVVRNCWQAEPPGSTWTTVMHWDAYRAEVEYEGVLYGSKRSEFERIEALPSRSPGRLEIAVGGTDGPRERWRGLGWSVVESRAVAKTAEVYRHYVASSRGEFSIAKSVYVRSRSGWFSCRSVCYLAAGRPAVLQDTGFSEVLPVGEGVVPFSTLDEAAAALERVERDYAAHQQAALELARTYFDSDLVLTDLLERAGVR